MKGELDDDLAPELARIAARNGGTVRFRDLQPLGVAPALWLALITVEPELPIETAELELDDFLRRNGAVREALRMRFN